MDKQHIFYRDSKFLVTKAKVKSPNKTYRLDKIEKVSLRRDPYFISLFILAFTIVFSLKFEIRSFWFFIVIFTLSGIRYFLKDVGLLFVTSKAISELAYIGNYERLTKIRSAIENAMHSENDGFIDDDDHDDHDDHDDE